MPSTRIQDYGLIGDGRSAALVSTAGSIEWLCWPRFDSPAVFAAALDAERGGCWQIKPVGPFRVRREYVPDSNVLSTTFRTPQGSVTLTDLMPVLSEEQKHRALVPEHEVLRILQCTRGECELELLFTPRPDYARRLVPVRMTHGLGARIEDGPRLYTLRSEVPLERGDEHSLRARFRMRAGDRRRLSLSFDRQGPAVLPPLGAHADEALHRTNRWWRRWARRCAYRGPYREEVVRSVLTLKLLSFAPSGASVAAPTTSLPERLGGDLNWDYRYCWVRDASLTVRALFDLGYPEEAEAFVSWLLHTTRLTRPEIRVLYDVYGCVPEREEILSHLRGHRGSAPVRIRNAAVHQLQLDAYGEVIDAVARLARHTGHLDRETRRLLRALGHFVCENWRQPDHGIWEPRQSPQHHTHSRVLCWTALDRLLELGDRGLLDGLSPEIAENHALLRDDIETHGWNPSLGSYTQVYGGTEVDAALLLLSWYGFADARLPRMRSTFERIRQRLEVRPGLYYRTEVSRALGEGAFGICSFWAAELLARGCGTLGEAVRCFDLVLPRANDLGLFAEEIHPVSGEPLGNFPQAFTHIGLINAALALEERRREEAARPRSSPLPHQPEASP